MPLQYAANWFYGGVVRSCCNEKQCLVNREKTARFLKDWAHLNGVVFVNLLCHRRASCWIALQANRFDGNDKREKQAYEWRAEDKDRGLIVSELQLKAFMSEPFKCPGRCDSVAHRLAEFVRLIFRVWFLVCDVLKHSELPSRHLGIWILHLFQPQTLTLFMRAIIISSEVSPVCRHQAADLQLSPGV